MHCPFCFAVDTKVIDSRLVGEGSSVRRRRQCLVCNERFTTFEVAELVMPRVVKSKMIGNLVMEQLKKLDKVAYIRFASVYRSFEDIKEFGEEIARLQD